MCDQARYEREDVLRSCVERALARLEQAKDPNLRILAREELQASLHAFGMFLFAEPL